MVVGWWLWFCFGYLFGHVLGCGMWLCNGCGDGCWLLGGGYYSLVVFCIGLTFELILF